MSEKKASEDVSQTILSSVGMLAGLGYAINKGSGIWGYVGYIALGTIGGAIVGGVADATIFTKKAEVSK